ncbi:SHOCT domain-containing protein [Protaetiibacter intestinalis]|nr:SHOCT domain-containing protein [Protaetiibacter intestinalis]
MILGFAESQNAIYLVLGIVVLLVAGAACVYFLRGQGPTTQEVETRLAEERKVAAAKRRRANAWGIVAGIERVIRPRSTATNAESAAAAQIDALSDPATAQAIQNLQKLLYTRAITDAEFEAAKNKIVGRVDDQYSQILKLAELHEAGILGDVEFAAAKSRVLGL